MEELREKDDPDDFTSLVYTVREDGSAMITDYSARFMGDFNSGFGIELTVPSEINGHPVTAIADGALREGSMRIFGITLPPTIKEIGNRAIYGRYLKYLKLNDGLEVIKDYAIDCGDEFETLVIPDSVKFIGDEAIGGEALKSITMPKNLEFLGKRIFFGSACKNIFIKPANIDTGKTVILALYDGDKFVEMQQSNEYSETNREITFIPVKNYTCARVMIWNSLSGISPVCDFKIIE